MSVRHRAVVAHFAVHAGTLLIVATGAAAQSTKEPPRIVERPLPAHRIAGPIPAPASVIGFEPGTDRKLPTWKQITDYFTALDRASPRVSVRTLGKTTLGRPFLVAFISDPSTLANLERYRQIQRKLMDPRLRTAGEREKLFLPYYSTKRRGSGLGLAIVRRIIAEHGGSIEAGDNLPHGTRFTIELPC